MPKPRSDPSHNFATGLLRAGQGDDTAVIDRTGSHSYADLRADVTALAQTLTDWGLAPGSRVGLLSRNSAFWVAGYLAILHAGHVAVPFTTTLTPADVRAKAAFVGADSFLLDSALARTASEVVQGAAHVADERALASQASTQTGAESSLGPPAAVHPDDDAVLMFTSGTTSAPRAVRVSHRNLAANTASIQAYLQLTPADRMLVVLPFSYCYGASLLHTHLAAGASLSVCDTFAFPETALDQIERDGCTGIAGVPSTYQLLLRASTFEARALPTLRHLQQAGGRLAPAQADRVAAAQPHADLFVMYGATEATSRMSYLPPEHRQTRRGSIGRGLDGVELTVVDETGQPVPTGAVGEIFARGESITGGYWNDPEGSAAKFVDGGLRTGDLARADEDGFLYVVDREADFIKSWGVRVSPHEIEDTVTALAGISAAAVVGRPDEAAGEAIVLFFVAAPGADGRGNEGAGVTEQDVLAHCRANLAKHLVPHEVHRLGELPLNQNGKVLKPALRALAADG